MSRDEKLNYLATTNDKGNKRYVFRYSVASDTKALKKLTPENQSRFPFRFLIELPTVLDDIGDIPFPLPNLCVSGLCN
jgi:hypothetical protein